MTSIATRETVLDHLRALGYAENDDLGGMNGAVSESFIADCVKELNALSSSSSPALNQSSLIHIPNVDLNSHDSDALFIHNHLNFEAPSNPIEHEGMMPYQYSLSMDPGYFELDPKPASVSLQSSFRRSRNIIPDPLEVSRDSPSEYNPNLSKREYSPNPPNLTTEEELNLDEESSFSSYEAFIKANPGLFEPLNDGQRRHEIINSPNMHSKTHDTYEPPPDTYNTSFLHAYDRESIISFENNSALNESENKSQKPSKDFFQHSDTVSKSLHNANRTAQKHASTSLNEFTTVSDHRDTRPLSAIQRLANLDLSRLQARVEEQQKKMHEQQRRDLNDKYNRQQRLQNVQSEHASASDQRKVKLSVHEGPRSHTNTSVSSPGHRYGVRGFRQQPEPEKLVRNIAKPVLKYTAPTPATRSLKVKPVSSYPVSRSVSMLSAYTESQSDRYSSCSERVAKSSGFIRTTPAPSTRKSDPVSRFHAHQREWKRDEFLARRDAKPKPTLTKSHTRGVVAPAAESGYAQHPLHVGRQRHNLAAMRPTYVIPSEKSRRDVVWEVRSRLARVASKNNECVPDCTVISEFGDSLFVRFKRQRMNGLERRPKRAAHLSRDQLTPTKTTTILLDGAHFLHEIASRLVLGRKVFVLNCDCRFSCLGLVAVLEGVLAAEEPSASNQRDTQQQLSKHDLGKQDMGSETDTSVALRACLMRLSVSSPTTLAHIAASTILLGHSLDPGQDEPVSIAISALNYDFVTAQSRSVANEASAVVLTSLEPFKHRHSFDIIRQAHPAPIHSLAPMPFNKRSESPAAVSSRDQDSNVNDALARDREKRDRANRPRTSSFKQSGQPNALNQPQPVLFNRGTGTLTTISIDDFVTHGSSPNTSSNSRSAHMPDPFSFAKTMRIDSKEFMDFWKFTQSEQTIRNLIFYKEFCYLEDNLAAQTPCRSPEQSSLFTRARQAGITQPILRFLTPSPPKAAVGSRDLIHSIPRIPVTEIPQELKHAYETLIHSYILSQPPNEINGISKEMRNALFIKVAGDSELRGLKTDALDAYVDAVVHYLYEEVFSRYVQSGSAAAAAAAAATDTVGQISMAFGLNHSRAASAASFHTNRKGTPSVSAGAHSQGGSGTRIMLEASFQDIHMFWEPYNGGAYVSGARRASDQGSDDQAASSSPTKKFSSEAPGSMRDIVGGLSMTPSSGVMLYTKPVRDGKQFDILMDISGFMERKDPDPVVLEYSRFCFVKVMDPNSVAYRDFSTFARLHKYSNHISFYEKTIAFDDDMAAQTAALTPQDASMYTRARDEYGITQSLSRFMQNTVASDASKNRFNQLPPLPRIPVHPIPETLKPAVVDMYGTFIGRSSAQEITFTNPPRRPAIQSALQQDFLRPIESDLLDACADDVLEMLYVNVFRDFVAENSGGKSTHATRLMDPVFGTPGSGRAKEKDMALPTITGGKLMRRGNSQKSEKGSSGGGGFLSSLFKGKKKNAGGDAAEVTSPGAAAKSSTSVFSSDMKRAMSPGPGSFMLYEIS
ncbi:hypothetical protein HDU78_009674, partial [Chytriomyces hyalinus]